MHKVDLHTHSIASPDGGLSLGDYRRMLHSGRLDTIAITDHNTISFAQVAQAKLGEKAIIVGEEITTLEGEIIGLYLEETIPAGMSIVDTIVAIREQGGLVYVPHPFETVRKGLPKHIMDGIANEIDIVETRNGRAVFQNRSKMAVEWTAEHQKVGAASSDAHGKIGWGRTSSWVKEMPTRETLVPLLRGAKYRVHTVQAGILHPKLNRLKRKLRRG